jgi:hypothetical protein
VLTWGSGNAVTSRSSVVRCTAAPIAAASERDRLTARVAAQEPAHPEPDQHRPPARRAVLHRAHVATVHPRRPRAAARAGRSRGGSARRDLQAGPGGLDPLHHQPAQMRKPFCQHTAGGTV